MSNPQLEINNLSISFGGLKALSEVSLKVEKGEIVGLIGPNGAGKTTVFNCISRYYKPTSGNIVFEGRDITQTLPSHVMDLGIARTFQNVELFKNLTVLDNLLIGQHCRLDKSSAATSHGNKGAAAAGMFTSFFYDVFVPSGLNKANRDGKRRAMEVLELLGLAQLAPMVVQFLPFGAQKMIELARALVSRPKLILLDEPAAGSNPHETYKLAALIKHIRDNFDVSVLLVEHDMSLVMDICERIYLLDFGKKIAEGLPEQIQSNPAVIEAYLGEKELVEE